MLSGSTKAVSALADLNTSGAFVRKASVFRNKVEVGGQYPPAKGRYTLYVSYACPWASRCLALREMKGLQDTIHVVVVSPVWGRTRPNDADDAHEGWLFDPSYPGASEEPHKLHSIRDLYDLSLANSGDAGLETRYTVPVLFDNLSGTIVNNESSDIIQMFNSQFNAFATHSEVDLVPPALREPIEAMNERIYDSVCNGVYRCGFATSQEAYSEAAVQLFQTLDELDLLLEWQRYLVSNTHITESDIRLFVTLVRFDEVYVVHFKCNRKAIREYRNLSEWLRDVYQSAGLRPTVNMQHIKEHYFKSHRGINKHGIVPIGPDTMAQLDAPHGREHLSAAA